MRPLRLSLPRLAALGFLLGAALPVHAQTPPPTFPANTVWGRTGIGPGPGQAIPFATLQTDISGPQSANTVFAGPTSGGAAFATWRALIGSDLPLPSVSTLGGVESLVCSAHQWLNSISTSGVPACSQPAYTDISGSLPNPSASTLGGVESLAVVAHQFLTGISTSGVPTQAQPATTDLSDTGTGTWTPAITTSGTAGTPAYTIQVGSYEKIGRTIIARFSIQLSSWSGSPTGNVSISGLPFTSASTTNDFAGCMIYDYAVTGLAASNFGLEAVINPNTATAALVQNANTGTGSVTAAQYGATGAMFGTCIYHT